MFELIKQSRVMYACIRKDKLRHRTKVVRPPIDHALVERRVDALFEGVEDAIKAVPSILLFIFTCWLGLELGYQRYAYFRNRYRSER